MNFARRATHELVALLHLRNLCVKKIFVYSQKNEVNLLKLDKVGIINNQYINTQVDCTTEKVKNPIPETTSVLYFGKYVLIFAVLSL